METVKKYLELRNIKYNKIIKTSIEGKFLVEVKKKNRLFNFRRKLEDYEHYLITIKDEKVIGFHKM